MTHEERIAELERITERHARILSMAAETTALMIDAQRQLIESDKRHAIKASEFDDKLNALMHLMDRHLKEGHHNGH